MPRQAWASFALAALALLVAGVAALGVAPPLLRTIAVGAGFVAVVLHLRLMLAALKTGMRRRLGRSFVLVRIAWAFLAASLVAALGVALEAPFDGVAMLFGVILNSHIMKKLRATGLPNRRSGYTSLATFVVMILSGYLLQVATSETWLQALVVAHIASGLLFSVTYAAHLIISTALARSRESAAVGEVA